MDGFDIRRNLADGSIFTIICEDFQYNTNTNSRVEQKEWYACMVCMRFKTLLFSSTYRYFLFFDIQTVRIFLVQMHAVML